MKKGILYGIGAYALWGFFLFIGNFSRAFPLCNYSDIASAGRFSC